ncbi:MAG TPA: L-asparaginase 1 [Bacteroidales bacterium]|nr:L-asparaginase 1 [Bacteroidales bacterium]
MINENSSVLIIYTGGTIGMMHNPTTGALEPLDFDHLYRHLPVLENLKCRIDSYSFNPVIDSSDMNPEFWIKLAEVIEQNYENYDGFVVLHGTDTMAYSASVLSFMLENLNKPVVFTGSQLPIGMIRSDGRENFITAVEIATAYRDGTPIVPEVSICFENKLFRGNRTTKFNAEHFDAFLSGNYPPLAQVGVHIQFNENYILKPNFKKLKVHKNLDTNILILKLFPGIHPKKIEEFFHINGLKGVIMETFGTGNAPTNQAFLNIIGEAIHRGILIFNVSQCKAGSVAQGLYKTSLALEALGVVSGADITTESALAKMMFLFGENYPNEEIHRLLKIPLRGEMSPSSI